MASNLNISTLYNNIKGSILSLGSTLGILSKENLLYPKEVLGNIRSNFDQANWCQLPFPYTFSVLKEDSTDSTNSVGTRETSQFKDFELPISPSHIMQSEDFAISIKPTQGGTVVTHSGNKYKNLQISGTTGLAPFRGAGGVDKYTGQAILQPDDLKHKSGYEVFLELRNYFKAYYEWKKEYASEFNVKNSRLVFKNYKDGEYLVVELLSFVMERDASRPFLYNYNLQFKVLKHFQFSNPDVGFPENVETILNKVVSKIDTARGICLRSTDILKQIEATYDNTILEPIRKIGLMVRAAKGTGYTFADLPKNLSRKTISAQHTYAIMSNLKSRQSAVLNTPTTTSEDLLLQQIDFPANISDAVNRNGIDTLYNLGEAITLIPFSDLPMTAQTDLTSEIDLSGDLPRSYYLDALANFIRIRQNAEDQFNVGDASYDALFERTATQPIDPSKVITDAEIDVLNAFNEAIDAIIDILSTTTFFKNTYDQQIRSIVSSFDAGELNLQSTSSVKQITLPAGTDLERVALNYLGDAQRWVEIAELNQLESPFVTQDPTSTLENVAKPGDKILLPAPQTYGSSTTPDVLDIPSTINLSYLEKKLGTDLKLTKDFDLSLGNAGDLEVVSGADNMGQQIVLKISYEKGDLINYPTVGSNLVVGAKIKPINLMKDDLVRTLMQDPRISKVSDVAVVQDNSAFYITFSVHIKNIDMPIPLMLGL